MSTTATTRPSRSIERAIELAGQRFGEALTLQDLAEAAELPQNTLNRKFNRRYGMSPIRWLWQFRTLLAAEIIAATPEWSLTEVALHCGFNSSAHFSRRFRELFRESPSTFRASFRGRMRAGEAAGASGLDVARAIAKLEAMRARA